MAIHQRKRLVKELPARTPNPIQNAYSIRRERFGVILLRKVTADRRVTRLRKEPIPRGPVGSSQLCVRRLIPWDFFAEYGWSHLWKKQLQSPCFSKWSKLHDFESNVGHSVPPSGASYTSVTRCSRFQPVLLGGLAFLSAISWLDRAAGEEAADAVTGFHEVQITQFLNEKCVRCHNAEKNTAGLDFTRPVAFRSETAEHWQEVLNNVQRGKMPPDDSNPLTSDERRTFLEQLSRRMDRLAADTRTSDNRFLRLTNQQIAWSWQDILKIDRDYARELIEDPQGEHGQSAQSSLELTGGHVEVYLSGLQRAVMEAIPDLENPPPEYRLHGNDWEKMHYLSRNDLAHGPRRKHKPYRGPQWLEEQFQIPLPPNHFFRIYLHDNRSEGQFRVRVHVRNAPPQNGGELTSHEMTVFMDKGFKSPMHAVDSFTVQPKSGTQIFEVFGNVLDFPGVDPAPVGEDEDPYGIETHFKYRFITVQNCSPLHSPSDVRIDNQEWVVHGDGHFVRADDQWIAAWGEEFGKTNWLKPSHAGAQHHSLDQPAVYPRVMQDTGYVVIERIEFDLPWQWPPASIQPFLENGALTDAGIATGIRSVAEQAWRHRLSVQELDEVDALIAHELATAESHTEALRSLLSTVLADARFMFLTDLERSQRSQNFERVAWLAAFLWRSLPDQQLRDLADREVPLEDGQILAEVDRMLADPRSQRFVTDFAAQWLSFHKLEQIAVNPNYYEWWNPNFKHYMQLEAIEFLSTLLKERLSCLNCLSSEFVVVNDMMAKYYGLPKPDSGHRYSLVPAPPALGGVLTQAAFLTAHSTGEDAHAVQRGVWLKARFLDDPPRDPPPAVPALNDLEVMDVGKLSTKERLAAHRTGICYDCHQDIDPWGIAMEGFDATGKQRQNILKIFEDEKQRLQLPVASATVIRGHTVTGMDDLKELLRENYTHEFARGFSRSMLSFALGRPLTYRDENQLEQVTKHFRQHDYRMDELIKAIAIMSF